MKSWNGQGSLRGLRRKRGMRENTARFTQSERDYFDATEKRKMNHFCIVFILLFLSSFLSLSLTFVIPLLTSRVHLAPFARCCTILPSIHTETIFISSLCQFVILFLFPPHHSISLIFRELWSVRLSVCLTGYEFDRAFPKNPRQCGAA